jgi:hypothetical protein
MFLAILALVKEVVQVKMPDIKKDNDLLIIIFYISNHF